MRTGEIIKKYRKEYKMSQESLARQTGISAMSIRRYESGEREIRADDLKRISNVLNIPSSILFNPISSKEDVLIAQIQGQLQTLSEEELIQIASYIEFLQTKKSF